MRIINDGKIKISLVALGESFTYLGQRVTLIPLPDSLAVAARKAAVEGYVMRAIWMGNDAYEGLILMDSEHVVSGWSRQCRLVDNGKS